MYLLVEEHADGRPTKYAYSKNKESLIKEAYYRSRSYEETGVSNWDELDKFTQKEYRDHCCGPYAYVHIVELSDYIE